MLGSRSRRLLVNTCLNCRATRKGHGVNVFFGVSPKGRLAAAELCTVADAIIFLSLDTSQKCPTEALVNHWSPGELGSAGLRGWGGGVNGTQLCVPQGRACSACSKIPHTEQPLNHHSDHQLTIVPEAMIHQYTLQNKNNLLYT